MKGEVYANSMWTTLQAAYLYYKQGKTQKEICKILELSPATVSRLIQRAKEKGIVQFSIPGSYLDCVSYAERIQQAYAVSQAIVVNTMVLPSGGTDAEENKRAVAKEGARFVQRTIQPLDTLGVAWGGTMYYLIHYLNPCQKTDNSFITLHGSLDCCDYELDVDTLARRMAMALGGSHFEFTSRGLFDSPDGLRRKCREPNIQKGFELLSRTTISVSGIGTFSQDDLTPLARLEYLSAPELAELRRKGVCLDLMLRFFDENGQEISSALKERTLSISTETYKRIPAKIIVAAGAAKAVAMRAVLRGGLADVIVVDDLLARTLLDLPGR